MPEGGMLAEGGMNMLSLRKGSVHLSSVISLKR